MFKLFVFLKSQNKKMLVLKCMKSILLILHIISQTIKIYFNKITVFVISEEKYHDINIYFYSRNNDILIFCYISYIPSCYCCLLLSRRSLRAVVYFLK